MAATLDYLRKHPWQRRALTLLVAVILVAVAAILLAPRAGDYLLVRRLSVSDPAARYAAIVEAAKLVKAQPHTAAFLDSSLDTQDDGVFETIATVLNRAGRFYTNGRDGVQIDRYQMLLARSTQSKEHPEQAARTRRTLLVTILLNGRDNAHVRRAAQQAGQDASPRVRATAAVLVAALGQDELLTQLLHDEDPSVVAAAALNAGLAGRAALAEPMAKVFARESAKPWPASGPASAAASVPASGSAPAAQGDGQVARRELLSSLAMGSIKVAPQQSLPSICRLLLECGDDLLRDRLLYVVSLCDQEPAREAVAAVLSRAASGGSYPSSSALLAAGRLKLPQAQAVAKAVVGELMKGGKQLPVDLVRAALKVGKLGDREIVQLCGNLWGSQEEVTLIGALSKVGAVAGTAEAASEANVVNTLKEMAVFRESPTSTTSEPAVDVQTPLPSAAAAVALWRLQKDAALDTLKEAADSPNAMAGQYIARYVRSMEVGSSMLPPVDAPAQKQEDRDNVRACGSTMLALAAGNEADRKVAVDRIAGRLNAYGGEPNFIVRGIYQCDLLALGQRQYLPGVRTLLEINGFPLRPVLVGLTMAGDRAGLDWLLWGQSDADLVRSLVNETLADVVNSVAGVEPVDSWAYGDVLYWQARICRDSYGVHRSGPLRLTKP